MIINFESKTNKFVIKCKPEENYLVAGLPDKRFRKASKTWAAPALRRNVEYLAKNINNPQMYSVEALDAFNKKRSELSQKPNAENSFPSWYDFKTAPMPHQSHGLKKFFPLNEAAILFEQGLGKTYTTINLASAWRMTNKIDSVVIIVPSSIKLVWEEELDKHCPIPTQRHVLVAGKYKQAGKFIDNRTDFQWLIVGIEGLSQGKGKEYIEKFMSGRKCLVAIDESSGIKTPNKIRTDVCINLGKKAYKRIIMSGTSITQGIEDLYTQFKFLNPDILGYDSYYSFRAQYCITIDVEIGFDPKTGRTKTTQKIVGYKNEDELMRCVKPFASRVEKKDVIKDLPDKTFTNRYVEMNPTQKKLYKEMQEELITEIDGKEYEVTTVLEQMLRLQQITGGHYPHDDGEKVVPKPIPGRNPKIDELLKVLDETDGKVIVWCQFRSEIEAVAGSLAKKEIPFVEFHGGCDYTQKQKAVDVFRKEKNCKVFLATRAAAFGLTLIEASMAVYFSQGYSLETYAQSQDRIHRIGQKDACTYIHLVCDKTVDTKVIKALVNKQAVAELIYSLVKD